MKASSKPKAMKKMASKKGQPGKMSGKPKMGAHFKRPSSAAGAKTPRKA